MKTLLAEQTNLLELLATLKQLFWVDQQMQTLHTASLPRLSSRALKRAEASLRMLGRAMRLTGRSIGKVERAMENK